ncbi:uncharacterized protein OGAPODRAFT_9540 [Ogataea polymorpha]|uniref:Uncharacterized protein n=1 Tax=Ogataea polymorpha TaxID=460523 RepID=A0A1B7SFP2_9ASCO|nr:uncharacterized protein OGAPODRAFT_9540 [Ogataea polymorpha]KAH3665306.1 hypothetical protein OGATHE_004122 [Ogataea polymorpha]OBA15296.1 hypothetical protein OGAPODRAFT_9540 [Ogataea polymorpha]
MRFNASLIHRLKKHKPLDKVPESVLCSPAFERPAKWSGRRRAFAKRIQSYEDLSSNVFAQIASSPCRAIVPSRVVVPRDLFVRFVCVQNELTDSQFDSVMVPDIRPAAKKDELIMYLPNDKTFLEAFQKIGKKPDFALTPPFVTYKEKGYPNAGYLAQNAQVIEQITLDTLKKEIENVRTKTRIGDDNGVHLSFAPSRNIVKFHPLTFHVNIPDQSILESLATLPSPLPANHDTAKFLACLYKTLLYFERNNHAS